MIVLDTNVVSELAKGQAADPAVVHWTRSLAHEPVVCVMTRAEILAGIERLPGGKRRDALAAAMARAFAAVPRVLSWDADAAEHYARVLVARASAGRPVKTADAVIASICLARGATLATRNTRDFEGTGLRLVNPWES